MFPWKLLLLISLADRQTQLNGIQWVRLIYKNSDDVCINVNNTCVQIILPFADGFSTFPSILAYFPNVSDVNLPPHWDMATSLLDNSPTILLHVDTGM